MEIDGGTIWTAAIAAVVSGTIGLAFWWYKYKHNKKLQKKG